MSLPSSGQISISSSVHAASTQVSFETTQSGKSFNYSLARLSRGDYNGTGDFTNGYQIEVHSILLQSFLAITILKMEHVLELVLLMYYLIFVILGDLIIE